MYKKIPGTTNLSINIDGQIKDLFGKIITLEKVGNNVRIDLFGIEKIVDLKWLTGFAWFECGTISNIEKHLENIIFRDVDNLFLKIRFKKVMDFISPVEYIPGFRYIPGYCRYAISKDGIIIDTMNNILFTDIRMDNSGYPTAYIRNSDRSMNRTTKVHRLVALAWIKNECFLRRPYVNHINGIKCDYTIQNLEWVSAKENVNHAIELGLSDQAIPIKVYDLVEDCILKYQSISDMTKDLRIGTGTSIDSITKKLPGYLWKKRYEIKLFSDETPWFHNVGDNPDIRKGKSIFTITVNYGLPNQRTFNNRISFCKAYSLPQRSYSLETSLKMLKEKYPDYTVDYKRNSLIGPYYTLNITNGELHTCESLQHVANVTNRTKAELQVDLSRGKEFIYNKTWVIFVGDQNRDLNTYVDKPSQNITVEVVGLNGEKIITNSIVNASNISGIRQPQISKLLNSGRIYNGYSFRTVNQ